MEHNKSCPAYTYTRGKSIVTKMPFNFHWLQFNFKLFTQLQKVLSDPSSRGACLLVSITQTHYFFADHDQAAFFPKLILFLKKVVSILSTRISVPV